MSLNFGYFLAKTADLLGPAIKRAIFTDDAGNVFPINAAEPTQQAALLAAIAAAAVPVGLAYIDVSVTLTANQAAGTDPILGALPTRKALIIVPPQACVLTIAAGLATGIPLLGITPNQFGPSICPTNQLYLHRQNASDLNAGDVVTILQA